MKNTSHANIDRLLGREIDRLKAERRLLKTAFPEIIARAIEAFEGPKPAMTWLTQPQVFCRGKTPLRWGRTARGRKQVLAQLARIDYGVYT